ncbi:MAG: hypothetical protein ABI597_11905 [Gammaproteobacteria bacterium]
MAQLSTQTCKKVYNQSITIATLVSKGCSSRKPASALEEKTILERNSKKLIALCEESSTKVKSVIEEWEKKVGMDGIKQLIQHTLLTKDKSIYLKVRDTLCMTGKLSQEDANKADKFFNDRVSSRHQQEGRVEPFRPPSPAQIFNQSLTSSPASKFTSKSHQIGPVFNKWNKDDVNLTEKQFTQILQLFQNDKILAGNWVKKLIFQNDQILGGRSAHRKSEQHVSEGLPADMAQAALQNMNANLKSIGIIPNDKVLIVRPSVSDPTTSRITVLDETALRSSLEDNIGKLKSLIEKRAHDKELPKDLREQYESLGKSLDNPKINEAKRIEVDTSTTSPKPYRR